MEEDVAPSRSDMLLLGGMRSTRGSSMWYTEPQGHTKEPPVPPRHSTRSSAPPPYEPKRSKHGFMIKLVEEEERLGHLEGRMVANVDFDNGALQVLGFYMDIYQILSNLGWVQFSDGVSTDTHMEFAVEMLMTMAPVIQEGVSCLSFRLKDEEQLVPYEYIRELLGFKKEAPEQVNVQVNVLEEFWGMISEEANRQRNTIRNPIIGIFHSWMSKRILGRMRETKVTDMELNWLYAGMIARQTIDPSYVMINRWACEAISGTGDTGLGCYLTMIAISLKPTIRRNPKFLLVGTSLGIEYMKHGKYISGDERRGYKLAKVNVPLPNIRLRLFIEGRENLLEEGLLVPCLIPHSRRLMHICLNRNKV
ncbi:uncharacterized protein LOC112884166 [Panicum hallii]|uniref:uncharacterized protein LOC112884166 n=1 Tax=Panicum hallii TaxID=206008 RepID=UPI000DF4E9B9|nr:uncharacterized protein LOC112884166 [Panicum hallii]